MALFDPFEYLVGGGEDVFGKKPIVPKFPDLTEIGKSTTDANVANFEGNANLYSRANQFNAEQIKAMLEYAAPGASSIIDMQRQNIENDLKGVLDQSTMDSLQRFGAEKAVGGGFSGSGLQTFDVTKSYLENILQRKDKGFDHAQQWLAAAQSRAPVASIANAFWTKDDGYRHATDKFQRDNYAANIAAAPDPSERGKYDTNMAILGMVLSAYGGGAGYQSQNVAGGGGGSGGNPYVGSAAVRNFDASAYANQYFGGQPYNPPSSGFNYGFGQGGQVGGWAPTTHTPGIAGDMYG